MTDFAIAHPVTSDFWGEVEDISLLSAALLSLNVEPGALGDELDSTGEPVSLDDLPANFLPHLEILRSAIRTGSLTPTTSVTDKHGELDENLTRIKTCDYITWCDVKGIKHNLPQRTVTQPQTKWPWGDHDTKLLCELAAAAEKFWKNYDPADSTTAPTNDQVISWLKERGVAIRTAQIMATMLRVDGLPPGPRR